MSKQSQWILVVSGCYAATSDVIEHGTLTVTSHAACGLLTQIRDRCAPYQLNPCFNAVKVKRTHSEYIHMRSYTSICPIGFSCTRTYIYKCVCTNSMPSTNSNYEAQLCLWSPTSILHKTKIHMQLRHPYQTRTCEHHQSSQRQGAVLNHPPPTS